MASPQWRDDVTAMATTGASEALGFGNWTSPPSSSSSSLLVEVAVIGTLVCLLIVGIVVGNAFVVASVAAFREMRTLTNWMIVSLASADLLVAVAVLPLSAYQVSFVVSLCIFITRHQCNPVANSLGAVGAAAPYWLRICSKIRFFSV